MKKITLALSAVLVFGLLAAGAFAFGGFGRGSDPAVRDALDAGDYDAFVTAREDAFRNNLPTEDRFNQMAGRHKEMQAHRDAVLLAIEANDYDAWVAAMEDSPGKARVTDVVTKDNFATFVKMHTAMESGDFETAGSLADELGLNSMGVGRGHGRAKGMYGGVQKGDGSWQGMHGNCPFVDDE